jgi:hypothetical protein
LFSRGIARAAADAEALIIDGGTQAGAMQIMGQSIVHRGRKSSLLGVAPAGKVTYPGGPAVPGNDSAPLNPDRSHFVLVQLHTRMTRSRCRQILGRENAGAKDGLDLAVLGRKQT